MPRMLPPVVDSAAPASERRVFDAISRSPDTSKWTVLHSLGMSSGYTGEYGEIDFVVIIPNGGIVCVEVKGGGVRNDHGHWSTTAPNGGERVPLKRSPFAQAKEGLWKLLKAIETRFGRGSLEAKTPLGWIVVLPDVECPPITPEFTREEVVDHKAIDPGVASRIARAPSLLATQARSDLVKPTIATCERILGFLRPSFERIPVATTALWDVETRMRALTEEQYRVLDGISENRDCLVHGGAGTGKTLLSVEAARRTAATGGTALVTCFNRNLGAWIETSCSGLGPGSVTAGNIHRLLLDRVKASSSASEVEKGAMSDAGFWDRLFVLGGLAIAETGERFDTIIVDEAQDFDPQLLAMVVSEWRRPDDSSRLILFGDFTRQAIYQGTGSSAAAFRQAFPGMSTYGLSLNCRNTRRIVSATERLTGMTGVRSSDRQLDGDPVETFYYDGPQEGRDKLEIALRSLRTAGFKHEDIAIIGPRRLEDSLLGKAGAIAGYRIRDYSPAGVDAIPYSTIHAFKGLERPVIILIDVTAGSQEETDAILYVGMTRARARLLMLVESSSRDELDARRAMHLEASLIA